MSRRPAEEQLAEGEGRSKRASSLQSNPPAGIHTRSQSQGQRTGQRTCVGQGVRLPAAGTPTAKQLFTEKQTAPMQEQPGNPPNFTNMPCTELMLLGYPPREKCKRECCMGASSSASAPMGGKVNEDNNFDGPGTTHDYEKYSGSDLDAKQERSDSDSSSFSPVPQTAEQIQTQLWETQILLDPSRIDPKSGEKKRKPRNPPFPIDVDAGDNA